MRRTTIRALLVVSVTVLLAGCGGGDAGDDEVAMDVAVHTGQVRRETLRREVTAYGYVEAEPAREGRAAAGAALSPFAPGIIAEVLVTEGQRVAQGEVLVRLDGRMARVEVQRAEQESTFAQQVVARQRQLMTVEGTSQRTLQEAEQRLADATSALAAARTALDYLQVTAPVAGTLVRLDARTGQSVDPSTVLGQVTNLGRLVVVAGVPVREAAGLAVGQAAFIGADSTVPRGRIVAIGREVDVATGSYRIQVSVPAGAGLMPGQFTAVRIVAGERRNVLAVPEESVVSRAGEGSWIVVVRGDSAFRQPVTLGLRDRGLVEVSGEGLAEGLAIVTTEAYSLPEATRIHRVAP